jgi:hypothetical protein
MFRFKDTYLFLQRDPAHEDGPSGEVLRLAQKHSRSIVSGLGAARFGPLAVAAASAQWGLAGFAPLSARNHLPPTGQRRSRFSTALGARGRCPCPIGRGLPGLCRCRTSRGRGGRGRECAGTDLCGCQNCRTSNLSSFMAPLLFSRASCEALSEEGLRFGALISHPRRSLMGNGRAVPLGPGCATTASELLIAGDSRKRRCLQCVALTRPGRRRLGRRARARSVQFARRGRIGRRGRRVRRR